jgi:hypothetical protein
MMALIIAGILGVGALAFVLYPLFRHAPVEERAEAGQKLDVAAVPVHASLEPNVQLAEQEQSARNALQEVEFDYQLGNIEQPDYQVLRERYMQRALVALKSRYEHEQALDDEIEMQLRKLKERDAHAEVENSEDAGKVEHADS